ncbi:MAG TPA: extensin family protein [Pseudolabrys sp.]
MRDEAAPRVDKLGSALSAVETYDDFECRGRNRISGVKLGEHSKGNAVDLRPFRPTAALSASRM